MSKTTNETSNIKVAPLNIIEAIASASKGNLVARKDWPNNVFVFVRPPDDLSVDVIINNVKSLPDAVKEYFKSINAHTKDEADKGKGPKDTYVNFTGYLCKKDESDNIINGWFPTQDDMDADDWHIVNREVVNEPVALSDYILKKIEDSPVMKTVIDSKSIDRYTASPLDVIYSCTNLFSAITANGNLHTVDTGEKILKVLNKALDKIEESL